MVRPSGFLINIKSSEKLTDSTVHTCDLSGVNIDGAPISTEIKLVMPDTDAKYDRVLTVQGTFGSRKVVILDVVYPDMLDDVYSTNLIVKPWRRLAAEALADAISGAIMNWRFRGKPPLSDAINSLFNTWLNTSPMIRPVDDLTEMKLKSVLETVVFEQHDEAMSHNGRVFRKEWIGQLDPSSTSTSDKVNLVYRRCSGTTIKDHRIVASSNSYCSTIADNTIVAGLGPRRLYLLRTTFENSEQLCNPDEPIVKPRKNGLSGVNLLTAVMDMGQNTFEDCVAISESAAERMSCNVFKTETYRSLDEIKVKVILNDLVEPGQVLAEDGTTKMHAQKIYTTSFVSEIIYGKTMFNGFVMNTVEIVLGTVYMLKDGDKLSNRHAVKAVVKVIPDNQMPHTRGGKAIDICVSPASIFGRRSMSMYYEMMASKATIFDNMTIDATKEIPDISFEELAQTYGHAEKLYVCNYKEGNPELIDLPGDVFVGYVYWIRINKHSLEMRSEKDDNKKVLNQYNVLVDSTSSNGQRFDIAKTLAMEAKGLSVIWHDIVKENVVGIDRFKRLMDCL